MAYNNNSNLISNNNQYTYNQNNNSYDIGGLNYL